MESVVAALYARAKNVTSKTEADAAATDEKKGGEKDEKDEKGEKGEKKQAAAEKK